MTLICENNAQKLRYKNPVFVDAEMLEYHDCDLKADARFHLNAPMKSSGLPLRSLPRIPVFSLPKCTSTRHSWADRRRTEIVNLIQGVNA